MKPVYIHYGTDTFDPFLFTPVRNGLLIPKPEDGTGLWASREYDPYGWRLWCERNKFDLSQLDHSFRFELSEGANLLILSDPEQLESLPKTRPWKKKLPILSEHPTIEELTQYMTPDYCYLDYEKLASDGVDAIELRNSYLFRNSLYGWDCDCIVVMNPQAINVLERE